MSRPLSTESVFRAVAHPTRRAIVMYLARPPCPAGELAEHLPISWTTLSRHLHILNACGVIAYERRGTRLMYELVPAGLTAIGRWMEQVSAENRRQKSSK